MGADVGSTPILNWLLWGYGLPALALAAGARELRRHRDDIPARLFEGCAILLAYLLVTFEIRHALHDGDVYAPDVGLVEAGLQVGAWALDGGGAGALRRGDAEPAAGGGRRRGTRWRPSAVAWIALGLTENPLLNACRWGRTSSSTGCCSATPPGSGPSLALYVASRGRRPDPWRAMLAATAFAVAFAYVNCEVALAFRGP